MPGKKIGLFVILIWGAWCMAARGQYYNQQGDYLKANGAWAFGYRGGMHFYTGRAVPARTDMHMVTHFPVGQHVREGCASIGSPHDGRFLFYAGGGAIWNRNHTLMPNGVNLQGDIYGSTVQGKCIVPFIDSPGKYYLFSLSSEGRTPGLFYSVIDTTLDNGLGDVVSGRKNILLDNDSLSEAMIAVPGNNCDIWLLTHLKGRPEFKVWHITGAGIDPAPSLYQTGTQISGWRSYYHASMAISPDRTLLALTTNQSDSTTMDEMQTGTLLCRFDPNTGQVSNAIKLTPFFGYGLAFSPDNSRLYTANPPQSGNIGGSLVSRSQELLQYTVDVYDSATIVQSATHITNQIGRYIKLYNDTIYACHNQQQFMSRINQPNEAGSACDFQYAAIPLLSGTHAYMGLPNDVVFPLSADTSFIRHPDIVLCAEDPGTMLSAPDGYDHYQWGDQHNGQVQWVADAGEYYVISRTGCTIRKDSFRVTRVESLTFSLGADTVLCEQTPFSITASSAQGASYLWQDGSRDSSYTITTTGQYFVTVEKNNCTASDTIQVQYIYYKQDLGADHTICLGKTIDIHLHANASESSNILWSTGTTAPSITVSDYGQYHVTVQEFHCSFSDTMQVLPDELCDCFIEVPNAFTPNGDGLNDIFRGVIQGGCPVRSFRMSVYNRWGQLVYTTIDARSGWDGLYKNELAEAGVYMYYIQFDGGIEGITKDLKGDLLLIR